MTYVGVYKNITRLCDFLNLEYPKEVRFSTDDLDTKHLLDLLTRQMDMKGCFRKGCSLIHLCNPDFQEMKKSAIYLGDKFFMPGNYAFTFTYNSYEWDVRLIEKYT